MSANESLCVAVLDPQVKHFQYITILSWKELCQVAYKLKSNLPLCFQLARLKRDALYA